MKILLYDGTFDGFLTIIFEVYQKKLQPDRVLMHQKYQPAIFDEVNEVVTSEPESKRVWNALCKKLSKDGQKVMYYAFLSADDNVEVLLLRFVRKVFEACKPIEQDFGDPDVLETWQIAKKVGKEILRAPMFVRFQKTSDNIYFACYDPDYDILHLTVQHFQKRFAGQKWIIYDTRRNYGYFYDLNQVTEVTFTESTVDFNTGRLQKDAMAIDELTFQKLWKIYFNEIAIKERINPLLQRKLMPRRYWKYLVEKWD